MMLSLFGAFIASFIVLLLLLKTPLAHWVLDHPNHRSLHTKLTPRSGGLAIMTGVLLIWFGTGQSWFWIFPVIVLMIVSIVDDMQDLSIRWRFSIQILVSAGFVIYLLPDHPWWILLILTLVLTWMINLYNFMDGADGLAGGMALFGFSTYALAAYLGQEYQLALLSGSIASASLAFLFFNFHPAQIFMGDAGSIPLGFLAAAIGLCGYQHALWPAWFPILVFSPFIIDASVTLFKRLCSGEKVWQAHRTHYYQRLVQMGLGHKKTVVFEYILMLIICTTALIMLSSSSCQIFLVLSTCVLTYILIMICIDQCWKQFSDNTNGDSVK